jgi:hypothetical protein
MSPPSLPAPATPEARADARQELAAAEARLSTWRRRAVADLAAGAVGLAGAGTIAYVQHRPTDAERRLHARVVAATAAWAGLLRTASSRALTDADLERAGVDADGPHIRNLVDEFRSSGKESVTGRLDVRYTVASVHVDSDDVARVHARLWFRYPFGKGPDDYTAGAEGRDLTFVSDQDGGVRLVSDVSDGHGHGGFL